MNITNITMSDLLSSMILGKKEQDGKRKIVFDLNNLSHGCDWDWEDEDEDEESSEGDNPVLTLENDWEVIKEILLRDKCCSGTFYGALEIDNWQLADSHIVYEFSSGDGNELVKVFEFKNPKDENDKLFVSFSGYYSSWDESELNHAEVSEPYIFTETRYKPIS